MKNNIKIAIDVTYEIEDEFWMRNSEEYVKAQIGFTKNMKIKSEIRTGLREPYAIKVSVKMVNDDEVILSVDDGLGDVWLRSEEDILPYVLKKNLINDLLTKISDKLKE
jgi:hypothetical protein